jgi:hypothetical protein
MEFCSRETQNSADGKPTTLIQIPQEKYKDIFKIIFHQPFQFLRFKILFLFYEWLKIVDFI